MIGKRFISMAMVATITLGSFSAVPSPARADNDAAKIIFGATALGIIAAGIAEANDDNDRAYVTRYGRYDYYSYPRRAHHYHPAGRNQYRNGYRLGYRHGYRNGYRDRARQGRYDRPYVNRRNW